MTVFKKSSSVDDLKHHWHRSHKAEAVALGVPLPSWDRKREQRALPSSHSALLSPRPAVVLQLPDSAIVIDDGVDMPSLSLHRSEFSSISSSSSVISASSLASSSSASSPRPVKLNSKRVYTSAAAHFEPAKRMKQVDIRCLDSTQQQKNEESLRAQVDFFLYEGISLRTADSPFLKAWLDAYVRGTGELLSRRGLAVRAHVTAQTVRGHVIGRLRACRGVTVGIDGWTNVRHDKVINLCPVGRSVAYYWESVVLKKGASAEEQAVPIADGLRSIINAQVLVVGIVTDNEAVNGAMYRRLLAEFPFLIHVPCAAHTVQLCVRKAVRLGPLGHCVRALLAMLLAFKHCKQLRTLLKEQQGVLRKGQQPLQLVTVVPTRWNSILFAAMRVLLLHDCLRPCIPSIKVQLSKEKQRDRYAAYTYCDELFWRPLSSLVDFLTPYKAATDIIQSDDACFGDVHHQFASLMVKADAINPPFALAAIKEELKSIIQAQWLKHVNINAVILCSLFSFDTGYSSFPPEEKMAADDWFNTWGTAFIKHYSLSTHDTDSAISEALEQQRSDFLTREGIFSTLDSRRAKVAKGRRGARQLWGGYLETAKEMAACVLALLELTASEAAVERSFSRQGQVHSKTRNRLADDSVQVHMCVAFNTRALAKGDTAATTGSESAEQELLDDDDTIRGTALLSQHYLPNEELAAADMEEDENTAEVLGEFDVEELEEEGVEEEEQKEEQKSQSMDERIDEVIERFCQQTHVTQGFKWNGPREQLLELLTIEAGLHVLTDEMKKRVKAHMSLALPAPISSTMS